ncbi:MAG: viral A-type inclusion protein [Chitinophagaceae bacterium]
MKKWIFPVILTTIIACNNADKKNDGQAKKEPQTQADSLMAEVMDGHDVGMGKMGKIRAAQKEAKRVLDSLGTLPAKAQAAAADLKTRLQTLINDLDYADFSMDKWMTEFNMDSAANDMALRIKYLTEEKLKVGKVKEAILGSLQKADSLLKAKFN